MTAVIVSSVLGFGVSILSVPFFARWARKKSLFDVPNQRSSHTIPTPRIGGVGILLGTLSAWAAACLLFGVQPSKPLLYTIAALIAGAFVGLADDIRGLPTAVRLALYLVCAMGSVAFGASVRVLYIPGGGTVSLGSVGGTIFSALFVAWYTNLFNFMDGINGIAGTAALVTMTALAVLFASGGYLSEASFSAAAAAACLGFLPFNFPKAKVFMGDGGAVFLGMAAGAFSLHAVNRGLISTHGVVLLMYPFVFDATFTLFRRMIRKEKFWAAHRSHLYQQLCDLGFSHTRITLLYFGVGVLCALLGLSYHRFSGQVRFAAVVLLLLASLSVSFLVLHKNKIRRQRLDA